MMENAQTTFTPKPIQNWLDKNNYNFSKKMSLQQWAWEFLRRNPLYQEDYARLRKITDDARVKGVDEDECMRVFDPPMLEGETESEWEIRLRGVTRRSKAISVWYVEKWKLTGGFLPDPFKEYAKQWHLIRFTSSPVAQEITENWDGFKNANAVGSLSGSVLRAFAFDLSMPIAPQISAAHSHLSFLQNDFIKKGKVDKWPFKKATLQIYPEYLRLLDAELSNATPKEMAEKIKGKKSGRGEYDPVNTVSKSLKKAQKVRDDHYWAIPMLGKKQRKEFS